MDWRNLGFLNHSEACNIGGLRETLNSAGKRKGRLKADVIPRWSCCVMARIRAQTNELGDCWRPYGNSRASQGRNVYYRRAIPIAVRLGIEDGRIAYMDISGQSHPPADEAQAAGWEWEWVEYARARLVALGDFHATPDGSPSYVSRPDGSDSATGALSVNGILVPLLRRLGPPILGDLV